MKMKKWPLAFVGLLVSVGACQAAYFQAQTYLPGGVVRVQKNLVSDYGATCNGQSAGRVATISAGSPNLAVTVNTFVSGDVGKSIAVTGAGSGGTPLSTTILTFTDAQHVVLAANAVTGLSSSTQTIFWGADDSSAFQTFKAAFQGTTPVQLNLPGMCTYKAVSGNNLWTLRGVQDIVVDGGGVGGIVNIGSNSLFLGGVGQYQDSSHSLRTDTANAGDSCVITKTAPAVTVSNITNNLPYPATFTASITSGVMTASGVTGTISAGSYLIATNGSMGFTSIQAFGTGGTTGVGGAGTYALAGSAPNLGSQTVSTVPASFTATVDAAGLMTVSAVSSGTLAVGMWVYRESGGVGNPTTIKALGTGAGGTGTYQLSNAPTSALATPSGFLGNGQPRVTLNSTTGLTTGDTLFLTGINATNVLPQRVNGLQWIKVINGTQIDLFQRDFNGSYTSGGTGGGDRTALMPTGSKVLMTGWNNQSYWAFPYGFPSNPHWFEYKTVVSTNSTTHQICFDTPLDNTYKSTWPQMNTGSQFEIDPAGPATLYLMLDWEMTAVFQNLTIDSSLQTYAQGRNISYNSVIATGFGCPIPTQNETFTYLNVTGTDCSMETDKIVKTWNITNSTMKRVHLQSSSIDTINIDGLNISRFDGTSKKFIANNLTTTCATNCPNTTTDNSLAVGVGVYGVADEFTCSNCSISGPAGSTAGNGFGYSVPAQQVNNPNRSWSMTSGVITVPNGLSWSPSQGESELQIKTLVPGHYALWQGTGIVGRVFKIVDVTQDIDNVYVQTNEAGGFPTGAWQSGVLSFIPHPAPQLTVSNMTGANSATILNGCPAATPLYSCQNYTYTGDASSGGTEAFSPRLWGAIDTFTFTNNVPYTNTGALGWTVTRFANWTVVKTDLTTTSFGATNMINTKLPSSAGGGTRTLTSSGATGTQSLDSLTAPPSGALFGGGPNNGPIFTANTPSDSPQVTMTLRTNQNLP